ncbi:MAG: (Fe-S)-binding protein [Magnetococcales bacterium]|nr:(Fe-S)-binding protein [Magnetococcales bacterium]
MKASKKNKFKNADLCTHCGYCLPICPSYRILNDETHSPRGRVSIILALARKELTAKEAGDALTTCLVCRSCHSACPVGVRPAKLVLSVRNKSPITPPLLSRLFHIITNSHTLTSYISSAIRWYQNRGLQAWLRRSRVLRLIPPLHRIESLIPEKRNDPIPQFPPKNSLKKAKLKAALLCGCMARLFHPRVAPSTANLMQLLDIEVTQIDGFGCCGSPFRESGNRDLFIKQAKKTLDAFKNLTDVDMVICDTSVCWVTVRSYARALSTEKKYAEIAKIFSEKIQSLEVLLANGLPQALPEKYIRPENSVTFHDHCQIQHGLGSTKEPRELLKTVAGELIELPRGERCCGAGGDYMLRYQELSNNIRQDKLAAIHESRAKTVVGSNSGCLINIEAGLLKDRSSVQVRHLAEVLWQPLSKD